MRKGHITVALLVIAVILVSGCTIGSESGGNETNITKASAAEAPKELCKVKAPEAVPADGKAPFVLVQKDVSGNWTVSEPTILGKDKIDKLGAGFASTQSAAGEGKTLTVKVRFYDDAEFSPYGRDSEKVFDNESAGFENSFVGYNPTARTANADYLVGKNWYVTLELKNDAYPGSPELRQADRELLKGLGKKLLC